jgi:hypothetical protein
MRWLRIKSISVVRFDHRLAGIQTLNERARRGELHISAISIHARSALPAFAVASAE